MPVCSIVKTITLRYRGQPDAIVHEIVHGTEDYCTRLSTVPLGNSFDNSINRHVITV